MLLQTNADEQYRSDFADDTKIIKAEMISKAHTAGFVFDGARR